MGRINIIKDRISGRRVGEFSLSDSKIIILKMDFKNDLKMKEEVLDFLNKRFSIIELNHNSNKKSRGSVTRAFCKDKRKQRTPKA